jgi:hypothetical protein
MAFFNFNLNKTSKPIIEQSKPIEQKAFDIAVIDFSKSTTPTTREIKSKDWVLFGEDNLYPQLLIELYNSSGIHQSIINQKAIMMVGAGYDIIKKTILDDSKEVELEKLLEFFDNNESNLQTFLEYISFDWILFGAIAIEVIWNKAFTRIVKYKRVSPADIRVGKKNKEGKVTTIYYSSDWSDKRINPTPISVFDINNKEEYTQIMYIKKYNPQNNYYGVPEYVAALNYISADSKIGLFHNNTIDNSFAPSLSIHFKKVPNSEEEKEVIISQLKKQYQGAKNAGKPMVFFSNGGDFKTDVDVIPVNDLDKKFTVLHEQIIVNICSSHRVTSTELFGIATPGKLGNSDIDISYNIFEKTVINPDRLKIEKIINDCFYYNGLDTVKIDIKEMNILKMDDNILIDDPTQLLDILNRISLGQLTKDAAKVIIKLIYSKLDDEKIDEILG